MSIFAAASVQPDREVKVGVHREEVEERRTDLPDAFLELVCTTWSALHRVNGQEAVVVASTHATEAASMWQFVARGVIVGVCSSSKLFRQGVLGVGMARNGSAAIIPSFFFGCSKWLMILRQEVRALPRLSCRRLKRPKPILLRLARLRRSWTTNCG